MRWKRSKIILHNLKLISVITVCFFNAQALAAPAYYIDLSVGAMSADKRFTQTIDMVTIDGHTLDAAFVNSLNDRGIDYGIDAGLKTMIDSWWTVLLGIGVYRTTDLEASGDYIFNGGSAPDAHYYYHLTDNRVMLSATNLFYLFKTLPSLAFSAEAGIGYGELSATDFYAERLSSLDAPDFNKSSSWQTAYQYGVGVEYDINKHWSTGVHYDVVQFGETTLKPVNSISGLPTGKVNLTRLSAQVRYQF